LFRQKRKGDAGNRKLKQKKKVNRKKALTLEIEQEQRRSPESKKTGDFD
jgi:hypothetical protein